MWTSIVEWVGGIIEVMATAVFIVVYTIVGSFGVVIVASLLYGGIIELWKLK